MSNCVILIVNKALFFSGNSNKTYLYYCGGVLHQSRTGFTAGEAIKVYVDDFFKH